MFKKITKLKFQTLSLLKKSNLWTPNNNKINTKFLNQGNLNSNPSTLEQINPNLEGKGIL